MNKITALKKKRRLLIKKLPSLISILRSTVSSNYLTCGYKNCSCHKGKKKHGPFTYLHHRDKGKTKSIFVPKKLVKDVKKGVKNYNILWKKVCKLCRLNREILWLTKRKK